MSKATGIFMKLSCLTQVQYLSATCNCSAQELYFTPAPLSLILHMSQRRVMCLPAFVYDVVLTANSAERPFRSLLMCLYSGHKLKLARFALDQQDETVGSGSSTDFLGPADSVTASSSARSDSSQKHMRRTRRIPGIF